MMKNSAGRREDGKNINMERAGVKQAKIKEPLAQRADFES